MQHGKSLNHCLSEDSSGDSTEIKDLVQTSVCITQHKWSSQVDLYLLIYFILFFSLFFKKNFTKYFNNGLHKNFVWPWKYIVHVSSHFFFFFLHRVGNFLPYKK